MCHVKIFLKSPKATKSQVHIALTYNGVRKKIYLKELINTTDIDKRLKEQGKIRLKKQCSDAAYINTWLDACEDKANEIVRFLRIKDKDYTLEDVVNEFTKWIKPQTKYKNSLEQAFKEWGIHMAEKKHLRLSSINAKMPLLGLIQSADIKAELFSAHWIDLWVNWLVDNQNFEGTYIKKRLMHLKEFLKFAIKHKYQFPKDFIDWERTRELKVIHDKDSISITEKEYSYIFHYDFFKDIKDLTLLKLPDEEEETWKERVAKINFAKRMDKIRDLGIILRKTGQHFIDAKEISNDKIQTVQFEEDGVPKEIDILSDFRRKTGNRYSVPLDPDVRMVLDKYNGKLPRISLDKLNDGLKELFTHLEITRLVKVENAKGGNLGFDMIPLNVYVTSKIIGRNAMSTRLEEKGVSPYMISKILGHRSLKQQDAYKGTTPEMMAGLKKAI